MYNLDDTIGAISTPPGESALAIVRLSGDRSKFIVEQFMPDIKLADRHATFGRFIAKNGSAVDEVVVIWYQRPHSYTGEDLVEIICHGGYIIPDQILSLLLESGARLAEPGEFTLRAFLNGRFGLTEAEAINSLIRAKSKNSKEIASLNLGGRLQSRLEDIDSRLFELITSLEAEIDFDDEEIAKIAESEIIFIMHDITDRLKQIMSTYEIGRLSEGKAQVAIVGAPNVGKSSLFNAILQVDRAIVTEIPGTTRDHISEYVDIGGYPVILTDTAGMRVTDDAVEIVGIDRTKKLMNDMDLCVIILDASRALQRDDFEIIESLKSANHIVAINKMDLVNDGELSGELERVNADPALISAKSGSGIENLLDRIRKNLIAGIPDPMDGVLITCRQYDCAAQALACIEEAEKELGSGENIEIVISSLREALEHVGEITGKTTSESILQNIFSRFCIGK